MKKILFCIYLLITISSCRVSLITGEWFQQPLQEFVYEDGTKPYITLNSGEKIFFEKIVVAKLHHKWLKADGKDYKANQVKNVYVDATNYFVTINGNFAKKIVGGKLSLYIVGYTSENGKGFEITNTSSSYYQKEGEADYKTCNNINQLQSMVSECPAASEKLNGSYSAVFKRMKKQDPSLIYRAIEIYNNGCK